MKKLVLLGGIFLLFVLGLIGAFYLGRVSNDLNLPSIPIINPEEKACTLEAKSCPDGSYVGRVPPNCDFAPCPTSKPTPTTTVQGDCVKGGCSGELCLEASMAGKIVSTCIYRDEYSCFQYSKCERQANGSCGWTQTQLYTNCLSKFQKQSIIQPQ